jgi:hypothetical protein
LSCAPDGDGALPFGTVSNGCEHRVVITMGLSSDEHRRRSGDALSCWLCPLASFSEELESRSRRLLRAAHNRGVFNEAKSTCRFWIG